MSDDHLLMCCCCRAAHQHIIEERDAEIERLRLTDAERKAIKAAIARCEDITYGSEAEPEAAATLRGLLERFAIGSGERDA